MMKSRSLAKRALLTAMRSMMGPTCSARDSGWSSHSHSLALNLADGGREDRQVRKKRLPCLLLQVPSPLLPSITFASWW